MIRSPARWADTVRLRLVLRTTSIVGSGSTPALDF
jgi:hypothetical protein